MKTRTLRATVHTYKTWELEELLHILSWDEFSQTKRNIIATELKRRKRKNYKDTTLKPSISISKRTSQLKAGT